MNPSSRSLEFRPQHSLGRGRGHAGFGFMAPLSAQPNNPSGLNWSRFPGEIQIMILENVADPDSNDAVPWRNQQTNPCKRAFSQYATVCKPWQAFFEPANFRTITISETGFVRLAKIHACRQLLIKKLWLRITLPSYGCGECLMAEYLATQAGNGRIVQGAIEDLFRVLSTWQRDESNGMTLQLSVHSPSDSEHFFSGLHVAYNSQLPLTRKKCQVPQRLHAMTHIFDDPPQPNPGLGFENHANRIFRGINAHWSGTGHPLPRQVPFITEFQIRRHTRRQLQLMTTRDILECLPNLTSLKLEIWNQRPAAYEAFAIHNMIRRLLSGTLPPKLKHLSLFEDYVRHKAILGGQLRHPACEPQYKPRRELAGIALAFASQHLEQVSVSYLVDAGAFFSAINLPEPISWPELHTLALTGSLIDLDDDKGTEANELLRKAARAARCMPKLRKMEIWCGRCGEAAVFRYTTSPEKCELLWKGTHELWLELSTRQEWELTVRQHSGGRCVAEFFFSSSIPGRRVGNHGDAIEELGLDGHVLDDQSRHEIQDEDEFFFFP